MFRDTLIGNAGLANLKGMSELDTLELSETLVGDDGLQHLSQLTKLSRLLLWRTKTTSAGLVHLRKLTNLRLLNPRRDRSRRRGAETPQWTHQAGNPQHPQDPDYRHRPEASSESGEAEAAQPRLHQRHRRRREGATRSVAELRGETIAARWPRGCQNSTERIWKLLTLDNLCPMFVHPL